MNNEVNLAVSSTETAKLTHVEMKDQRDCANREQVKNYACIKAGVKDKKILPKVLPVRIFLR